MLYWHFLKYILYVFGDVQPLLSFIYVFSHETRLFRLHFPYEARGEPTHGIFYPLLQLKEYVTAPSVKPKFNTDFLLTYKFCTNHEYVNVFVLICSRNSFRFATCTKHLNLQRIGRRNYSMLQYSILFYVSLNFI